MQSVDGDVRLSVSFDMKSVQTNLVQLKKAIKDTLGGFDSVDSKVTPQVADLEKELANATDKINELTKEVEELSKTKLDKTFDGADKQVEKATNEAKELKAHTEGIADSAKDVNAEYDETAKEMERIAELAKKAVSQKNEGAKFGTEYIGDRPEYHSYKPYTFPVKSKTQPAITAEKSSVPTPDTKEVEKTATAVKEVATNIDYASQEMNKFNSEIPDGTSKLQELHTAVKKAEDTVSELSQKLNEVGNAKVPTAEYTAISQQIANAEKELDKLYNRQAELKQLGKDSGSTWETLNVKIQNVERVLGDAKGEMSVLVQQGKAFTEGSKTPKYAELVKQLKTAQGQLLKSKSRVEEFTKSESESAKTGSNIGKSLSKGLKTGEKSLIKLGSKVKSVFSAIASRTKSMSKTASGAFSNIDSGVKKGIKSLLKYGLSIKSLYILVRKLKGYIQEGLTNLAGYSDSVNNDISKILSALEKLKNALATLVQPIIRAVQPAVTSLLNQFTAVTTKVAEFFAALTGQNYVYKAADTQKKFVESLDDTADSADKAKKSLDEYLSPLDDLNKFQDDKTTSTTSTKSKTNATDPSKMFTTEPVSDKFKKLANDLKKMFKSADWTDLGKYLGNALNKALKKIDWNTIQKTIKAIATKLVTLLNGFISQVDWTLVGKTIGNSIQSAIQFAYTFITNFDWVAFGEAIANAINGAISAINPAMLAQGLSKLVIGIFNTITSLLDTINWDAFGKSIVKFISNIKWGNLSIAVVNLIQSFSKALRATDFKSIGTAFKKGIDSINWKSMWNSITNVVTDLVKSIADLFGLKGINTSKLNKALKNLADPVSNLLDAFGDIAKTLLPKIVNDLVPSLVNLLGEVLKGVEPIVKAASPILDTVIDVISQIVDSLSPIMPVIGGIISGIVDTLVPVLEPLIQLVGNIVQFLAPAVEFIGQVINTILAPITTIGEIVGGIMSALVGDGTPTISAKMQEEISNLATISSDMETVSDNVDNTISTVDTNLQETQDSVQYVDTLQDRMDELLSKSTLTPEEMQELNTIADLIAERFPEFKSTWENYTTEDSQGKTVLTGNQQEIRKELDSTIDKLKEQYRTEALKEQYTALYKEQVEASTEYNQAVTKVKDAQDKATEASNKQIAAWEKMEEIGYGNDGYKEAEKVYNNATAELDAYADELGTAQEGMLKASGKVEQLNTKMNGLEGAMKVVSGEFDKNKDSLQDLRDAYDMGFISVDEIKKQYGIDAKELFNATYSVADMSVKGYNLGINKGVKDANEAGIKIGQESIKGARTALNEHSPSKEFVEIGEYSVKGYTKAIDNDKTGEISITKWAKRIIKAATDTFRDMTNPADTFVNRVISAFSRIPIAFKNILNTVISDFETFFNYTIRGINNLIDNLNLTNKNIGQSTNKPYTTYGKFSSMTLPRLATGAVIPPNKEFMAVLGDQKQGTNIETPEKLLRQIVREELGNTQNAVPNKYEIPLQVGRRTLATLVIDEAKLMLAQTGKNPFELA